MTKTQSELFFEKFCDIERIEYSKIDESDDQTPDYEIKINEVIIIAEVKEITPNAQEQESERLLIERGYGEVLTMEPGERVRKKISDATPQIKARTKGSLPSILVLFDRGFVASHLDPYNIRVAMYGLEQINIAVSKDPHKRPYNLGMSYGPKRKMTPEHNTSISAIGVLYTPSKKEIRLSLYHNKFAENPIDPNLLSDYQVTQYMLGSDMPGGTAKWEEIVN